MDEQYAKEQACQAAQAQNWSGGGIGIPAPMNSDEQRRYMEKHREAEHDRNMQETFAYLTKAAEIKADAVLMGDLKRWLAKTRAKIESQIKDLGL